MKESFKQTEEQTQERVFHLTMKESFKQTKEQAQERVFHLTMKESFKQTKEQAQERVCFSLQRSGAVWTWRWTWALILFPVLHPVPNKPCGFCRRTAPWKKKERLFALKPMRLSEAHRNCNGLFLRVVVFVENMVCS